MCLHKLGEVEIEYTSEKPVLSAIFVPKIFYNPSKFGKVMTKNKFAQFFETRCTPYGPIALRKNVRVVVRDGLP